MIGLREIITANHIKSWQCLHWDSVRYKIARLVNIVAKKYLVPTEKINVLKC